MSNLKKLITEVSYDFTIDEGKSKDMHIVGIFSTAEAENNNKRRYKKDILEREVDKIKEKVEKKSLWGELGHPPNPEVNPDKIAIKIENLEWKGNNLYGKAKLLDTPMGQIAKTLVKEGSMGISSRGLGTVGDDGYVNEDFNLITYDLVTDPSNKPSWVNGIYEGKEFRVSDEEEDEEKVTEEDVKNAQKTYFYHLMETLDNIQEAMALKNKDIGHVVDDFVRYLIGDRNKAISGLRSMSNILNIDNSIPEPGAKYNKLYDKLFNSIVDAIQKNMKDV